MTIQRRSPLPRKRSKPRRWKSPRCVSRGCRLPQKHIERCAKHARSYLDGLWAARVRTDRCEIDHLHVFPHGGSIQACHGFDRDELGVRWDLRNGLSGCAAANAYFHSKKHQWYAYLRVVWGDELYEEMERLSDQAARGDRKPDHEAIRNELLAA